MELLRAIPAVAGIGIVAAYFLRFLRAVYVDGALDERAKLAARSRMILPAAATAVVLIVVVLLTDVVPSLIPWLPALIGGCAVLGMVWALERGRRAALAARDG